MKHTELKPRWAALVIASGLAATPLTAHAFDIPQSLKTEHHELYEQLTAAELILTLPPSEGGW